MDLTTLRSYEFPANREPLHFEGGILAGFSFPWNSLRIEVFYFSRWVGYGHPVTPTGPLTAVETLREPKYYEVFLQNTAAGDLILALRGIAQECREIDLEDDSPAMFKSFDGEANAEMISHQVIGHDLSLEEAMGLPRLAARTALVESLAQRARIRARGSRLLPKTIAEPPFTEWSSLERRVEGGFVYDFLSDGRLEQVQAIPHGQPQGGNDGAFLNDE